MNAFWRLFFFGGGWGADRRIEVQCAGGFLLLSHVFSYGEDVVILTRYRIFVNGWLSHLSGSLTFLWKDFPPTHSCRISDENIGQMQ